MKFTRSWLADHLATEADAATIAETMTAIGLEVEDVVDPAAALAPFRIARVLTAAPHPQADKLQVLTVDPGDNAPPLQVVCGAPNARAGLVGVFGAAGATVPANGMVLKVASIRGVESNGMMCSARELGLGEDHDGIIELPADAPIGAGFATWAGHDDIVFDVAITPNRPDCMGVRGIARDLAAAGLGTLKPLAVPTIAGAGDCAVGVRIDDAAACPALYARSIAGVRNDATTPGWMARRLEAIGQRLISPVVDITNYVMFDLGRPSHAYDVARLSGPIVVRRALDGEALTALNGKDYRLDPSMTVIADDRGAHDIAGIMGGDATGVTAETTDILLEVAYFTPEAVAATGQALALTTDARARFERGVDPGFLDDATAILTGHIVAVCGGSPSTVLRTGTAPDTGRHVPFDPALTGRLGGIDVEADEQARILTALGFGVADGRVSVPGWRRDVDGPADLVEEVVRITGLDRVESVPLPRAPGVAKATATPAQRRERRVRRAAAARGLNEAVTWSFIDAADADRFGGAAWRVVNPIASDMVAMRPSLLPGLLRAAARNAARGAGGVRLFEIGRHYGADAEHSALAFVLTGARHPRDWARGRGAALDAYDAKAEALALLDAAGAPVANLQVMGEAGDAYHPGQSATLRLGPKTVLARIGAIHPALARAFDLDGPVVMGEVLLDAIPPRRDTGPMRDAFAPPALQAVRRDFAFVVPATLAADALVRAVRGADKALITDARVFDRFALEDGTVSLGIEATVQPRDRNLTDADLSALATAVVAAAAKLGATLRG